MQLTTDFQWSVPSILTNSERQSPECNKTKRQNQAEPVFTELVEVYGFIWDGDGGKQQNQSSVSGL